jgi:hypothetical protein
LACRFLVNEKPLSASGNWTYFPTHPAYSLGTVIYYLSSKYNLVQTLLQHLYIRPRQELQPDTQCHMVSLNWSHSSNSYVPIHMRLCNITVYQICQNYSTQNTIILLVLACRPPQYYALPKVKILNAQVGNLLKLVICWLKIFLCDIMQCQVLDTEVYGDIAAYIFFYILTLHYYFYKRGWITLLRSWRQRQQANLKCQ